VFVRERGSNRARREPTFAVVCDIEGCRSNRPSSHAARRGHARPLRRASASDMHGSAETAREPDELRAARTVVESHGPVSSMGNVPASVVLGLMSEFGSVSPFKRHRPARAQVWRRVRPGRPIAVRGSVQRLGDAIAQDTAVTGRFFDGDFSAGLVSLLGWLAGSFAPSLVGPSCGLRRRSSRCPRQSFRFFHRSRNTLGGCGPVCSRYTETHHRECRREVAAFTPRGRAASFRRSVVEAPHAVAHQVQHEIGDGLFDARWNPARATERGEQDGRLRKRSRPFLFTRLGRPRSLRGPRQFRALLWPSFPARRIADVPRWLRADSAPSEPCTVSCRRTNAE